MPTPDRIAYDTKLMKPGCALIQAGLGCDSQVASEFPTDLWLTSLTPDLSVYPIDEEKLAYLVKATIAFHKERK